MLRKTQKKNYMRIDAPKKKIIWEQMFRKKNRKKLYENRWSDKKIQHKQYKHSIRREVLQIKTTARDCANFQCENKGLKKQTTTKNKTAKPMTITSYGSFVCTSDTKNVGWMSIIGWLHRAIVCIINIMIAINWLGYYTT
jgi:hypothetical protein